MLVTAGVLPELDNFLLKILCMRNASLAAALVLIAACDLPRDPENTLERIRERGEIRVGVTDSPPLIRRTSLEPNAEPRGVEADLIRELAEKHGVGVRWHWGNLEEHYAALEGFDLDLVAGGISNATPWKKKIGITRPYIKSKIHVGFPPGQPIVHDLENVRIAVKPASELVTLVQKQNATAVLADRPFETNLPVAAPDWELRAHGYTFGKEPLHETKHVMAVPPGENGWLVAVERHLLPMNERIESMLEKAAAQ